MDATGSADAALPATDAGIPPEPATPCAAGATSPLAADSRLVFLADADTDDVRELYLVNSDVAGAPTPIKLHTPITEGNGILFYEWSPDRTKILYIVDRPMDDDDLYVVDLATDTPGAPQRVSTLEEAAAAPAWSADSSMIAYTGDDEQLGRTLKVSKIVDGIPQQGVPVTTSDLFVGSFSRGYLWSPCRPELVFAADEDGGYELFYVDLSGADPSAPIPIADGGEKGHVSENSATGVGFRWSPDGRKIAYESDQGLDGLRSLYVVDVSGPLPARARMVNAALRSSGVIFSWSPTGQYLAFAARQASDVNELYIADVSGPRPGVARRVSKGAQVEQHFLWAPDGSSIAFHSIVDGVRELFMVSVSASKIGSRVRVNDDLPSAGQVTESTFGQYSVQYSPDGKWLAYLAEQDQNNVVELFASDISSGTPATPVKVNGELVDVGDVSNAFWWSPDSKSVLYRAIQDTLGVEELYVVDMSTGSPGPSQKVSGTLPLGGSVQQPFAGDFTYGWSPTENLIAFRADADTNEAFELFAVEPDVDLDPVKISMDLVLPFSVWDSASFAWAPRLFLSHGEICEPGLPVSCASGLVCRDTAGGGGSTCTVAACEDGADNDGDGNYDYPADPGCASPKDGDETNPPTTPRCANLIDDDGDGAIDFSGGDPGCQSASDNGEADECVAGVKVIDHPGGTISGDTSGGSALLGGNAFCQTGATAESKERVYRFRNDKGLITVTFSTAGSTLDTILYLRKVDDCAEHGPGEHCHDDVVPPPDLNEDTSSLLTLEYPQAGTYYVVVDGKDGDAGPFELTITGEIPLGQPCDPADADFVCQPGLTCTGGTCSE